uniref:Uncharacterized protein n=1 Tax=Leersia perrieri TaxID=77586 RepID=A0A0D9XRE9_9ORYZ
MYGKGMNAREAEHILLDVIASGSSQYWDDPEIDQFIYTEEDAGASNSSSQKK